MKNRGTIALIVLFFAGLVGLWWADSLQVPSAVERERQRGRILGDLVNLRPDDLRKIEIEGGPDSPALIFERRDGRKWQMTAPLDVAANPSMVEGLALNLKSLTRKPQADTLTGDPATYGLAPPSKTIRLWGAASDSPLATLALGKTSLDRRYLRAGIAGIEVVPAQGLELVDLPPIRWRDRELFRVPTFEVDAVTLTTPALKLQFERGPDAWRIVEPIRALVEESKLEGLVASLGSLRITNDSQFIADDVGAADRDQYGLAKPSLTVTIAAGRTNQRRPLQILEVGKPVPGQPDKLYARSADQNDVVTVDARLLNEIAKAQPNDFRTTKVADINPNRATRLRIESTASSFELTRSGNAWFVTQPSVGRADSKAVQEFFQTLEGLRTSLYLPPGPMTEQLAGLKQPSEVIKVWQAADPQATSRVGATTEATSAASSSTSPTFTISLGNRDAGKKIVYAQVSGDSTVLALPDSLTTNLFKNSWAFRDRLILTAPTEKIERISFAGLGKQVSIQAPIIKLDLLNNAAVGWWLSEPVVAPADTASVTKILKLLGALRVDGYAAESPPSLSTYGLDHPLLRVTWAVPAALPPSPVPLPLASDPSSGALRYDEQTLLIGAPVADQRSMRYAMFANLPIIFMLGGETLATLDAEWHTHQVTKFDPTQVAKLHLNWPGSPWSFDVQRTNKTWSIAGPIDIPGFDPAAADAVLQAMSRLSIPRYSQYTGTIPATIGLTPPHLVISCAGVTVSPTFELAFGSAIDSTQAYAAIPATQPGAVFLVDFTPFAPWLTLQPPLRDGLPPDVFQHDPVEPAQQPTSPAPKTPDRPGQTGGQPR